jgi:carbon-monoxide dehydrogenase medium subunit
MKPVRFSYYRPDTIEEALGRLRAHDGRARVLAGGQSLLAGMNRRAIRPEALIDLGQIARLRRMAEEPDGLRAGAMVTHAPRERVASPGFRLLAETARLIGTFPIRTRGTVGGSLAYADPRSEWCLLAVLLRAQVTLTGPAGSRTVPAAKFFTGGSGKGGGTADGGSTVAGWDELVTEVVFPRPLPGTAIAEFGPQAGQFPLVSAGAAVSLAADGAIADVTIVLGGVAGRPVRASVTEPALLGTMPDDSLPGRVSAALASELRPPADKDASAADRAELAGVVAGRALRSAIARNIAYQQKGEMS